MSQTRAILQSTSEQTKIAAEQNLAAAGYIPTDIAKIAGALQACAEAELSVKEASEFLQVPTDVIEAVLATVQ